MLQVTDQLVFAQKAARVDPLLFVCVLLTKSDMTADVGVTLAGEDLSVQVFDPCRVREVSSILLLLQVQLTLHRFLVYMSFLHLMT